MVDIVLEWWHVLSPGWMILGEGINGEDLSQLGDVLNLQLLQLQVSVEDTVVELAEEGKGVSLGQVLLLAVIDGHVLVNLRGLISSHWVWDSLEPLVVGGSIKSLLKVLELSGVVKSLGPVWVQVAQVIEVLFPEALTLHIAQLSLVERVVDDLESFPIALSLEKFVHHLDG